MKKFLIILCGILAIGENALAKSLTKPHKVEDDILYSWMQWSPSFTEDLSGKFMAGYMIGNTHTAGACGSNDEGAGVAIIATNIFDNKHGAQFCTRQIQAANAGSDAWIDFYATMDNYKCYPFCKPGYYGSNCNSQSGPKCNADMKDYKTAFGNIKSDDLLDTTNNHCNDTSKIKTGDTPVFMFDYEHGGGFSQVVVLGVQKILTHGIIVGAVDIHAKKESNSKSYIESVKGNGVTYTLCAEGFVPNSDNSDCITAPGCETTEEKLNNLCSGFSKEYFEATEHNLEYDDTRKCYYYSCLSGKGFKGTTDKTCVECPGGVLAYVDHNGFCQMCNKGEYPNPNNSTCSDNMTQYSRDSMKENCADQCWMKTSGTEFSTCVTKTCNSTTQ